MKNKKRSWPSIFNRNKGIPTGKLSPTVILNSLIYLGKGKSRQLVIRKNAGTISKETKQYPNINHNLCPVTRKLLPNL